MNRAFVPAILILWQLAGWIAQGADEVSREQMDRGSQLFAHYCAMCHQPGGQGSPPVFPPLAGSDFLAADKERSIRILITGLKGPVTVRNRLYNNIMPPAPYDDAQLADVLTYVDNSFGNTNGIVTTEQVKKIRAQTAGTEILVDSNPYLPLPEAPAGFTLRQVAPLPDNPTKIACDSTNGLIYVLCASGDVWRVEIATGATRKILNGEDYAGQGSYVECDGLMLDAQRRLYITSNLRREAQPYMLDDVTIYRTTAQRDGDPAEPRPWLRTNYPWGIGSFNHGVNHIATGSDGFVYVTSGARTDGNEPGEDPRYYGGGEVTLTSSIWRLDPRKDNPEIEFFARGVRNPYGFCWNDRGEMFATENGPDANAPEELNQIERGKHYGFPYLFSNWTNKAYPYSPDPPPGLKMTLPIANFGPAAGGSETQPLYTFDPHSSPGGIVFLGDDFPPDYRGTFLVARFGNLLETPKDVGFDLLQIRLRKNKDGVYEAHVSTFIAPLSRPVDIQQCGPGKIYIAEYTRVRGNYGAMMPGRILELAVKK